MAVHPDDLARIVDQIDDGFVVPRHEIAEVLRRGERRNAQLGADPSEVVADIAGQVVLDEVRHLLVGTPDHLVQQLALLGEKQGERLRSHPRLNRVHRLTDTDLEDRPLARLRQQFEVRIGLHVR